jgi:tetratricopeptide (TPR) repeat protein
MTQRNSRSHGPVQLTIITAIAAVVLLTGCSTGPDISEVRQEGITHFDRGEYIESMATLRYALEYAPGDPMANYYMGLNYRVIAARKLQKNQLSAAYRELDNAIRYFTLAIKGRPNFMEAIASKNEALEARGKYREALELAERVADNIPVNVSRHFVYLGNEYLERGDYDNALRAYKIALDHNPRSALAYAAMGRLYQQIGDTASAREHYNKALRLDPNQRGVKQALESL